MQTGLEPGVDFIAVIEHEPLPNRAVIRRTVSAKPPLRERPGPATGSSSSSFRVNPRYGLAASASPPRPMCADRGRSVVYNGCFYTR